jgi:hypothetical protein
MMSRAPRRMSRSATWQCRPGGGWRHREPTRRRWPRIRSATTCGTNGTDSARQYRSSWWSQVGANLDITRSSLIQTRRDPPVTSGSNWDQRDNVPFDGRCPLCSGVIDFIATKRTNMGEMDGLRCVDRIITWKSDLSRVKVVGGPHVDSAESNDPWIRCEVRGYIVAVRGEPDGSNDLDLSAGDSLTDVGGGDHLWSISNSVSSRP